MESRRNVGVRDARKQRAKRRNEKVVRRDHVDEEILRHLAQLVVQDGDEREVEGATGGERAVAAAEQTHELLPLVERVVHVTDEKTDERELQFSEQLRVGRERRHEAVERVARVEAVLRALRGGGALWEAAARHGAEADVGAGGGLHDGEAGGVGRRGRRPARRRRARVGHELRRGTDVSAGRLETGDDGRRQVTRQRHPLAEAATTGKTGINLIT